MNNSKLPLLLDLWKNRSQSVGRKESVKFFEITKQNLPYIETSQVSKSFHKKFKKIEIKQNRYCFSMVSKKAVTEGNENEGEDWRIAKKKERLVNQKNFQKSRLEIEYKNLKANRILRNISKEMHEKQFKVLNEII